MTEVLGSPYPLGTLPTDRLMTTVDELVVKASVHTMFAIARNVEHWPAYLPHYRYVRFRQRTTDGGGIVEMAANRPFGIVSWPTWWLSEMAVNHEHPWVRFRHIGGITTRMDVEWSFTETAAGTLTRIVHVWNGPSWPVIGLLAAQRVIGPVFVHGIASRTLAGLARVAEQQDGDPAAGIIHGEAESTTPRDANTTGNIESTTPRDPHFTVIPESKP